ncbi:MAG: PhzF family phenazine biosynthesis protein [Bryobacterales bacterium]|nr:PhzF family phenazine biosynthesis protein [Bryobacterales bacterium]
MPVPLLQVDAFTSRPFGGNPAAVCLLDSPRSESWMQAVAAEMNLSETAFLHPEGDGYRLRWFTPEVEVELCGHATLASAHVLWETGRLAPDARASFHTLSGALGAGREGDWIVLDFPATPQTPAAMPPGLLDALGAPAVHTGRTRFDFFVELGGEQAVRGLKPDFQALAAAGARGIIVTARADGPEYDFVSRFFAPASGINEDPVTGSAHCCLAPYWSERLGKTSLTAWQASKRGGMLRLRVEGDRVRIAGQAVTVLRGELAA